MKTLANALLDKYGKKSDDSLNESQELGATPNTLGGEVKRYLTQFTVQGNARRAIGQSVNVMEAGVYKIQQDMQGIYFERTGIKTDGLIRFKDERYEGLLAEAKNFWGMKETFKSVGMNYQRGIILKGAPGGGKSCILKLMMEDVMAAGDIVLLSDHPRMLTAALKEFKEVDPDRNVMVVIEEVDEVIQYNQRAMSELLDGQDKVDGVLFVATTNHIERIHPKFLREGRFDLKIEIGMPPRDGRTAYLREKIGLVEAETIIEEIADATDGFSFAQLREYVISVYCYKKNAEQVIKRIRSGSGLDETGDITESHEDISDEKICESVFHYYYAQDPVRSTKQFASNRNMEMAEFSGLAGRLLKKYGAKSITVAQENLDGEYKKADLDGGAKLDKGFVIVAQPDDDNEDMLFFVFKNGKSMANWYNGDPSKVVPELKATAKAISNYKGKRGTESVVQFVSDFYDVPVKELTYVTASRHDGSKEFKKVGLEEV